MTKKSDATRQAKRRWRAKMGLIVLPVEIPERYAARFKAMAERITRRHVEKVKKDDG